MRVGVDIGGTFTDFVMSRDGQLQIYKLPSTPDQPSQAMLEGLRALAGAAWQDLKQVVHGSTVATNAILERKGARAVFITTQGFRDVLFIGRQNRPELYALQPQLSPPLIPRESCYEVAERLDHHGQVLRPLDTAALERLVDTLLAQGVEAIAVCLLYSYANPTHEHLIRDQILARGLLEDWQIALSSAVLPQFREYERASTVALEAYVRPVMARYIGQLEQALPQNVSLTVMKSDGGVMRAERVREQAIHTALSGPAAGVIGAFHLAQLAGHDRIITLDMGGTSTDVALCAGGPSLRPEAAIDGLPLRTRTLDIETIGAGGGSIARLDAGGALRVGPHSAGAVPGPIIYGRGGAELTVSDANALLGRLDAEHRLGGTLAIELAPAETALKELGARMKLKPLEVARGIIDVTNVHIERALRRVSIARGHDPRDFTLVAFGGAGPLHACEVGARLGMRRVLVPRYPGVLCAFGLLVADVVVEYSRPVMAKATRDVIARLRAMQGEMLAIGQAELEREGIAEAAMKFRLRLDMRYEGQAYELTIPFKGDVVKHFHEAHERAYGHAMRSRVVEIINLRLQAIGIVEKPLLTAEAPSSAPSAEAQIGQKRAPDGDLIALYARDKLLAGMHFEGPALVLQMDSTTYIPPRWSARVDGYRNLILEAV